MASTTEVCGKGMSAEGTVHAEVMKQEFGLQVHLTIEQCEG